MLIHTPPSVGIGAGIAGKGFTVLLGAGQAVPILAHYVTQQDVRYRWRAFPTFPIPQVPQGQFRKDFTAQEDKKIPMTVKGFSMPWFVETNQIVYPHLDMAATMAAGAIDDVNIWSTGTATASGTQIEMPRRFLSFVRQLR